MSSDFSKELWKKTSEKEKLISMEDGGIKKIVRRKGEGDKPKRGDIVTIHFEGKVKETGQKFDSTFDRDKPFSFLLGSGTILPSLDKAVATMKKGERSWYQIHPELGFGSRGKYGKVLPDSTLEFIVDLLDVKNDDDRGRSKWNYDGDVKSEVLRKGVDRDNPREGAKIVIKYRCEVDDEPDKMDYKEVKKAEEKKKEEKTGKTKIVFDYFDKEIAIDLDAGDETIVGGLEEGLLRMERGEKTKIWVSAGHGYGTEDFTFAGDAKREKFKVPKNTNLIYTVELIDFNNGVPWDKTTMSDKFNSASKRKGKGNIFFKMGNWKRATTCYMRGIAWFQAGDGSLEKDFGEDNERVFDLLAQLFGNVAFCRIKMKHFEEANRTLDQALAFPGHASNWKLIYRKAQIHVENNELEKGVATLDEYLKKEEKCKNDKDQKERDGCVQYKATLQLKIKQEKDNAKKSFGKLLKSKALAKTKEEEEADAAERDEEPPTET